MTENQSEQQGQPAAKVVLGKLYRMKEVISGLIALAEDGSIGMTQTKTALHTAFKKQFTQ